MNHAGILEVYNSYKSLRGSDAHVDFVKMVDAGIHELIKLDFRKSGLNWKGLPADVFFKYLLAQYPEPRNSANSSTEERFRTLDEALFAVDIHNPKCYNGLFQAVKKILEVPDAQQVTPQRVTTWCAILTDKIGKTPLVNKKLWQFMKADDFKPTEIDQWFVRVREEQDNMHAAVVKLESYGFLIQKIQNSNSNGKVPTSLSYKGSYQNKNLQSKKIEVPPIEKFPHKRKFDAKLCRHCGRSGHEEKECKFVKDENNIHPDANTTNEPWASSEKGKAWAEKGQEVLPFSKTLLGGAMAS